MNTAGRLLLLCLALGLVFESLGIPVADDVKADRDTDPGDKDARGFYHGRAQVDCSGTRCEFGCCEPINGEHKCRELDCDTISDTEPLR
nr:conotoxin precursor H [Conus judaeus]DAZ86683.1 TPA_inf: conotoxin precursor H [Conus judaeus]